VPVAPFLAGVVIFTLMALEARLSRQHERNLRALGAIEPPGDVHGWMTVAYPGGFLAIVLEGILMRSPTSSAAAAGVALFALAKVLKYWAIRTLGDRWSFRVLVPPGAPLIVDGPYRIMRHPNYLAVVGEFVGATLVFGAWMAGPAATLVFLFLIRRRTQVEEAALARGEQR
jgi:methyltransferase